MKEREQPEVPVPTGTPPGREVKEEPAHAEPEVKRVPGPGGTDVPTGPEPGGRPSR